VRLPVQVAALIVLVEGHDGEIFLAGVLDGTQIAQFDLGPCLGGVYRLFLRTPLVETLGVANKIAGVVLQIARCIQRLPVASPVLDCGQERLRLSASGVLVDPVDVLRDDD